MLKEFTHRIWGMNTTIASPKSKSMLLLVFLGLFCAGGTTWFARDVLKLQLLPSQRVTAIVVENTDHNSSRRSYRYYYTPVYAFTKPDGETITTLGLNDVETHGPKFEVGDTVIIDYLIDDHTIVMSKDNYSLHSIILLGYGFGIFLIVSALQLRKKPSKDYLN
jgi:hypothetical protein